MQTEFWEDERGRSPVKEYLDSLPEKPQRKIIDRIVYLQERGLLLLNSPYLELLKDSLPIYALRISHFTNEYRIDFLVDEEIAWLIHGYTKKSDKIDRREMATARRNYEMYMLQKKK